MFSCSNKNYNLISCSSIIVITFMDVNIFIVYLL